MKKLLSMALAMLLLFASVGVFAEGEATEEPAAPVDPNLVWSYSFEDTEAKNAWYPSDGATEGNMTISGAVLGEDGETVLVAPFDGEKMLAFAGKTAGNRYNLQGAQTQGKLKAHTKYKLSFRHYVPVTKTNIAPYLCVGGYGAQMQNNSYWFGIPPAKYSGRDLSATWNYYEIYFVTKDDLAEDAALTLWIQTTADYVEYYDDFRLEEQKNANVGFATGSVYTSSLSTIWADSQREKYITPQKGYTIDGVKPYITTLATLFKPATAATGTVKVYSHYIPKKLTEKTTMVVAIYEDVDGKPCLKEFLTKDCEYTATSYDKDKDEVIDFYRLGTGVNTMDVDMTKYGTGAYIRAFMWSNTEGMLPLGSNAVLGK